MRARTDPWGSRVEFDGRHNPSDPVPYLNGRVLTQHHRAGHLAPHGQRRARQVRHGHVRRRSLPMTNAETQLASFFAKYEPAMVKLGKALRAKLRARLPGLFEIVYVYESQNAAARARQDGA